MEKLHNPVFMFSLIKTGRDLTNTFYFARAHRF